MCKYIFNNIRTASQMLWVENVKKKKKIYYVKLANFLMSANS